MPRRQVVSIGAGPAGLLLGHLLRAEGVDCVIVERATPDHVLGRIRAGVLERTTTDLLHCLGIDERLNREGLLEEGFCLADGERLIRISTYELTGKHVTVYGQTEVTRDLMDAAPEPGLDVIYQAAESVCTILKPIRPM
jgi:p-hydroxybenzoate 3-monooxygenase